MSARSWPLPRSADDLINWAYNLIGELRRRERRMAAGTVSLAVSPATETVVADGAVLKGDVVTIFPADAAAAADATPAFVANDDVAQGQFTITHVADAGARTVNYLVTRTG